MSSIRNFEHAMRRALCITTTRVGDGTVRATVVRFSNVLGEEVSKDGCGSSVLTAIIDAFEQLDAHDRQAKQDRP